MSDQRFRSDEEIMRYYRKIAPFDFFGIWGTELIIRLPLSKAIPFMGKNHGWDEESWSKAQRKLDKESILEEVEDFIQDAIERCMMHKKIAVMSLDYFRAWMWLINDMDVFSYLTDDRNFPNYGAPMVKAVMDKYEFTDLLPNDERQKSAFLNMAMGKKCNELCVRGCGIGSPKFFKGSGIILPGTAPKTLLTPKVVR